MNIQTWFDAIWVENEGSFKSCDLRPNILTPLSSVLISLFKQEYRQTMSVENNNNVTQQKYTQTYYSITC